MIRHIAFHGIGPFTEMTFDFGPGINLLTGDNGLGKTFVLENIWWALTRTWPDKSARPYIDRDRNSGIDFAYHDYPETYSCKLNKAGNNWVGASNDRPPCIVLYAKADSGVSVWNGLKDTSTFHFKPQDILDGLRKGGNVFCSGLISDWCKWQDRDSEQFRALTEALKRLSPDKEEVIRPGKPVRPDLRDVRDIPTLEFGYGQVPITHASAGMRRIVSFAYLLVWWIFENQFVSERLDVHPAHDVVILFDEIEAHLHPQWQRVFIPALLKVTQELLRSTESRIQLVGTTHAPLVLASVEPNFAPATDTVHTFELKSGEVAVYDRPWAMQGDATNWLVSESFGLEQARSVDAEIAIEAAEAFMRNDKNALPSHLQTEEAIHQELLRVLASHDEFWPRWIVSVREGAAR